MRTYNGKSDFVNMVDAVNLRYMNSWKKLSNCRKK